MGICGTSNDVMEDGRDETNEPFHESPPRRTNEFLRDVINGGDWG